MGKPKDPGYWSKWRAAHPEYRERERQRALKRTTEQRRAERQRAQDRARREDRQREVQAKATAKWREANREHYDETQRAIKRKHGHKAYAYNAQAARQRRIQRWVEDAHRIAGEFIRPDTRDRLGSTLYEDAHSEALAVIIFHRRQKPELREGRARAAVAAFIAAEREHRAWSESFDDEARTGVRAGLGIGR